MGSVQSKLIPCVNELCVSSHPPGPQNRFQSIDYSCHELLHTWTPSCSQVIDLFLFNKEPKRFLSLKR